MPMIATINIRIQCARGFRGLLWPCACLWVFSGVALGQTATNITGLYNTGEKTSGYSLVAAGTQLQSSASAPTTTSGWYVSYGSINGGTSANTTYQGDAYAFPVSGSGYTPNTSTAEWVVAPGAGTNSTGSSPNTGGFYLPGNGNSGSNEGIYVYTLAFRSEEQTS